MQDTGPVNLNAATNDRNNLYARQSKPAAKRPPCQCIVGRALAAKRPTSLSLGCRSTPSGLEGMVAPSVRTEVHNAKWAER